jgi:ADP-ribose pyrophosphatase YjhB (NUDIX family)
MPLYRGDSVTLDSRLRDGETVKVVLLNKLKNKVYLTYELPVPGSGQNDKPAGYSLPGGGGEDGETLRDVAYRETMNETGFVTIPERVLYVIPKRNHNPLKEPHRLIVVLSKIVPGEQPAGADELAPQAPVVEKDEVDPKLNGWFEIANLPIQIDREIVAPKTFKGESEDDEDSETEVIMERGGIYPSHFLILNDLYNDGVISVKPFCADLMHIIAEREAKKAQKDAVVPPVISADDDDFDDLPIGWDEEAIKSLIKPTIQDDEGWRRFGESLAAAS